MCPVTAEAGVCEMRLPTRVWSDPYSSALGREMHRSNWTSRWSKAEKPLQALWVCPHANYDPHSTRRSGMSRYGLLRQSSRGLGSVCSGWVKDLKRQLGFGMVFWQPPAANLQHSGLFARVLPAANSFYALAARRQPGELRIERQLHPAFASCSSSSNFEASSGESDGRSSPTKRRSDGRKGLQSVAGIGPRNEQRLVSKGIESVDRLKEVFYTQKKRNEEKMLTYLQVSPVVSENILAAGNPA